MFYINYTLNDILIHVDKGGVGLPIPVRKDGSRRSSGDISPYLLTLFVAGGEDKDLHGRQLVKISIINCISI